MEKGWIEFSITSLEPGGNSEPNGNVQIFCDIFRFLVVRNFTSSSSSIRCKVLIMNMIMHKILTRYSPEYFLAFLWKLYFNSVHLNKVYIFQEIPSTLYKAAEVNVRHHLEKLRKDGKAAYTDGSWRKLEYMDIQLFLTAKVPSQYF